MYTDGSRMDEYGRVEVLLWKMIELRSVFQRSRVASFAALGSIPLASR